MKSFLIQMSSTSQQQEPPSCSLRSSISVFSKNHLSKDLTDESVSVTTRASGLRGTDGDNLGAEIISFVLLTSSEGADETVDSSIYLHFKCMRVHAETITQPVPCRSHPLIIWWSLWLVAFLALECLVMMRWVHFLAEFCNGRVQSVYVQVHAWLTLVSKAMFTTTMFKMLYISLSLGSLHLVRC